ncbi:hypothetical protein [Longimicrobium sp.]|uniref:hypothetical protein n=1 Tax=Longimicrobium sp. TaxID=2029185 RepID=UPI002BFF1737|nr:hypothetical protein [Longimicrobium sp.]HSU17275.1 hypothetical protein [Longimicrobium sp.]
MRRFPAPLLVFCIAATCARPSDPAAEARAERLVVRGAEAFIQHRLGDAEALLDSAAHLPGAAPRDRSRAEQMLALLAWRYRGDVNAGRAHYSAALNAGALASQAWAGLARMETARRRFADAREAARKAMEMAESLDDSAEAATQFGAAATQPVLEARLAGRAPSRRDESALHLAVAMLQPVVSAGPGMLRPARQLVTTAVLSGDGPAALAGWKSYFLTTLGQPGNELGGADSTLSTLLPRWVGGDSVRAEHLALFRALAASRMFDEAAAVGAGLPASPEIAEVGAYAAFLRRVRATTDEYYRLTALGKGDSRAFRRDLDAGARRLWPALFPAGAAPAFGWAAFQSAVHERFGTYAGLGNTAGYFDLHLGHAVLDRAETVEQYGHAARLRYVVLDELASDGFQTWAWDGEAAHGGWADTAAIYEVRPARAGGALQAWARWVEPRPGDERARRLPADSADDWGRAARAPYGFLPGVLDRLQRDGTRQIADSLRARGLAGAELQRAFIAAYDAAAVRSGIFAHEGRHAIDHRLGLALTAADLEYRAKLSEIAFAPVPRLALTAILQPSAGDRTPHGQANARALRGLEAWMRAHAREIPALDAARPLLPQAPLLTDAQIRAAFRSLDPFATQTPASH